MSDAGLIARQVRVEQRVFWRNLPSAFFTFVFPILFLIIFGTLNKGGHASFGGHTVSYNDYYIPALVAFGVMGACFTNIAMTTSIRRDNGVLKRLRGTPLPPWAFMAGILGSSAIISLILVLLTTGFGMLVYGIGAPGHPLALLLTLPLGALCFCALGLAMTVAIPNADAAPAIVNVVFLPLVFISGTFFPVAGDTVFGAIANVFPVRHFISASFEAFDPARLGGSGLNGVDVLVLSVWGLAGAVIAARRFRWEPRRS